MITRRLWIGKIEAAWERNSVIWLRGTRRSGKTCLARSLGGGDYLDCELPAVRRAMEESQSMLGGWRGKRVVLDEVHRLQNGPELLKAAAENFPEVKVLAVGPAKLEAGGTFGSTSLSGVTVANRRIRWS